MSPDTYTDLHATTERALADGDYMICPVCGSTVEDFQIVQDATVTFSLVRGAAPDVGHVARYRWDVPTPDLNYLDNMETYAQPCGCSLTDIPDGHPVRDAVYKVIEALGGFTMRPE